MGLHAAVVCPVPRASFPKTTSGKIQRGQLAARVPAALAWDAVRAATAADGASALQGCWKEYGHRVELI